SPLQSVTIAVQNEVPKEIADVPLSTNYQPHLDPAKSPQPVPLSDSSNYNAEHLEYVDSSLAPISSIQSPGNTLADVLAPRAYDPPVPSDASIPNGNSEQPSPPSPNSSLV
ncbi:hypothetical protein BYT27DRAFT_7183316, partial [Phlegmacium glaucopus]